MGKHFIVSTRTLVSKRDVTLSFGSDNTIYVPLAVMEEIEAKYYDQTSERGKIAREVLNYLGSFHMNDLKKGVTQRNGSTLKVTTNYTEQKIPEEIKMTQCSKLDMRILKTCLGIKNSVPKDEPVILVSKENTLRKKAEMLGIMAQTFRDELLPEISEQYTGRKTINVSESVFRKFYEERKISIEEVIPKSELHDVYPNMFIELKYKYQTEEGRIWNGDIIGLTYEKYYPYKVVPMNVGQRFMIEALMMDYELAPLVIVKGPAGTAKTFLSLAVGLELVEQDKFPNKILISRSPTETGEKIGFLPGGEIEKIQPYLRGIMDNLTSLHSKKDDVSHESNRRSKGKKNSRMNDEYYDDEKPVDEDGTTIFAYGIIKAEAIGYIRGRSICDTYIIIDEAQNLSPVEVKTIITRVGKGSKLILLGDPAQIDRPDLDERNNGLSYASERMKGEPTCWQITMTDEESVRSELAKRASILL